MQLGISSFGEVAPAHVAGGDRGAQQRMQELLALAKLADEVGLDVMALGEHHRADFIISAPEVILAAIAAVTQRIRLSSAVTVLSSADPVRVFQNFATVDLISNSRAEIIAGHGSFIESYPLFGYYLNDYDELFAEKLSLLLKINASEVVSWQGKHRPGISGQGVYPRPVQPALPVWIGIGGTPAPAVRAGKLGLPSPLPSWAVPSPGMFPLPNSTANRPKKPGTTRPNCRCASTATSTRPKPRNKPPMNFSRPTHSS